MSITVPEPCKHCRAETHEVCVVCHGPFCAEHASVIDPTCCMRCVNEETAKLNVEPLVDDEGVQHNGKHITPVGAIYREKTLVGAICEMSDEQLKHFVQYHTERVKELERSAEYSRIAAASGTVEIEQRGDKARRKLRGIRVRPSGGITVGAEAKKKETDPIKLAINALVACGLPYEQAKVIVEMKLAGKL